ncbi:sporulation peptidase YabG [Clostridium tetani]|uniref:Sporulation peptidase YabG n=1 Tax=Clostridium tetani TaxID=1513 RepID=A0ABY0ESK4_CLOTA|nr:sporulation peptidase YabG [Clostridium tetani]CDI48336.1 peptidase [Clostridium tetani 12124569]KHO40346.1 peptidase [Clostridium tetani]RXI41070.1 sporulation peptidase YabG [Clostridium tetani]RXI58513.1 sporulation peptidase YabG [Clostridium tetani]RXI73225.1 sporulation peptidase YabG [Clostridium tetani]
MNIGDIVARKSYGKDITFKIIDIQKSKKGKLYKLKGVNLRIIADSLGNDLELVKEENTKYEKVFDERINTSIKNILMNRGEEISTSKYTRSSDKEVRVTRGKKNNGLAFGRPGKILHVDGDAEYLDVCMKVYKQLELDVVGAIIAEKEQPEKVLQMVKEVKPDIVIITGHDAILKNTTDYMDLNNYRNSKYFIRTVNELRNYEPGYDNLVIFAGACQSYYEAILDAGANFASAPNRVLIHCLDPVFLCEKIAYSNIGRVVSIQEALENTITGANGIGGLQTRGKYREGFPKSLYS